MDFQRQSRRSLLESALTGLASLVLAGASYCLPLNTVYAQDVAELKEKANIIEVMPISKQVVANNAGRKPIPPIRDIKYANNIKPFPKEDFDILLAEDKTPKQGPKETPQETEKRAYELLEKYGRNVATIACISKDKTQWSCVPAFFITSENIITPHGTIEDAIRGGKILHYIIQPEFQNLSEELEVHAVSQQKNVVLLHTKNPNKNVTIPNLAINDVYRGEKLIGIYGRFPEGDEQNKQIKFNEDLTTLPYKGISFNLDGDRNMKVSSNCGFKYTIGIGYASQPLKNNGILQIGLGDPTSNTFTIPTVMNTEIGNLGMLVCDSKGKVMGPTLTKMPNPNTGEMLHPSTLRDFLRQYQAEALKRNPPQAQPKK